MPRGQLRHHGENGRADIRQSRDGSRSGHRLFLKKQAFRAPQIILRGFLEQASDDAAPMNAPLDTAALDTIFLSARTHNAWHERPVPDALLQQLYDLCKWGPTSANCSPLRVLFVRSAAAKERLVACMNPGNVAKTRQAPVTAILAMDLEFYEELPRLFPHAPDARSWFAGKPAVIQEAAFRNSSLQGGYFIVAARALGLDCGPMSGFDAQRLNAEFFEGSSWRVNFVCNLGYGDASALYPRAPRLPFDVACRVE
jgi:nitroreductase